MTTGCQERAACEGTDPQAQIPARQPERPDVRGATPVTVVVRSEVVTTVGTLAPGARRQAMPSGDGGWLLGLSAHRGRIRAVVVRADKVITRPPTAVAGTGRTVADSVAVHEEYRFAREVLGYRHSRAIAWLIDAYGVSERQILRWGLTQRRQETPA
ncbi:hypothetical protein [Nocardia terpenica]|uniref:Uncharacterized protein n=1 Tax=Nocardia terpenica TaxID=455432 RepID=A0A164H9R2_9NOCA|nr:hypothetical protein [Nocardia terpenica]KZM68322.1 hypothetical protein AWN90_10540 [Nocardia terpenica]NQE88770.1 hypothetical protein [Nocardia terpenica]